MPLVRIDLPADPERLPGHGIAAGNVVVRLLAVGREDWSFGHGTAEYAVADRAGAGS